MNDVTTEATKGFFTAFKDNPFLLASLITNAALLGYLYYQGAVNAQQRTEEMRLLYANRDSVGKLLQQCYPTPPK